MIVQSKYFRQTFKMVEMLPRFLLQTRMPVRDNELQLLYTERRFNLLFKFNLSSHYKGDSTGGDLKTGKKISKF